MLVANRGLLTTTALLSSMALALLPVPTSAQGTTPPAKPAPSATSETADKGERWLHVRVISTDGGGETVRINVPLELAEKVLPAVNHDRLHHGKLRIDSSDVNDVDLHAVMDAVRTAKPGEYVTVQCDANDVRVAKEGNHLIIHALDKGGSKNSTQLDLSENFSGPTAWRVAGGGHDAASEGRSRAGRDARVGWRVHVARRLDSRGRRRVPIRRLACAHVGARGNGADGHAFRAQARVVRCGRTRPRRAAGDPRVCQGTQQTA